MKKQLNKNINPILRGRERIPFEKINARFLSSGWDSSIECDQDWGWHLLALKNVPGFNSVIRRIKPFNIKKPSDLNSAIKLQQKKRRELVEVIPFKIYKGNRIFFSEVGDYMDFMSEAKFPMFRKFFKSWDISLKQVDKTEARKNKKA